MSEHAVSTKGRKISSAAWPVVTVAVVISSAFIFESTQRYKSSSELLEKRKSALSTLRASRSAIGQTPEVANNRPKYEAASPREVETYLQKLLHSINAQSISIQSMEHKNLHSGTQHLARLEWACEYSSIIKLMTGLQNSKFPLSVENLIVRSAPNSGPRLHVKLLIAW